MKLIFALLITSLLTGCGATIQTYENYSIPTNVKRSISVGNEVYRVTKTRDLPNAFGKADIFGGKVNSGYSELRYMGLTADGKVIFRMTDIDIESNESTMTRYSNSTTVVDTNAHLHASAFGNTVTGTGMSNTTITHYEKPKATVTQLPPNTVEFAFDPAEKVLRLSDVSVEILRVEPYVMDFILHKHQL